MTWRAKDERILHTNGVWGGSLMDAVPDVTVLLEAGWDVVQSIYAHDPEIAPVSLTFDSLISEGDWLADDAETKVAETTFLYPSYCVPLAHISAGMDARSAVACLMALGWSVS